MRIMVKGGVWKNAEDEILKAAVMKYGKNQWARVSSLLVRKSASQCKARWNEWLDPSIKKTEWTKEEEEKLLHLAKLLPTQWRTIAPIVGRTAAQCLEHYERLLDQAQAATGEAIDASDDPRRLRPGEIDPQPETKPPRPDPVDMDEDEKEMLSEARARLANTKGKKAKRKAREKQLEEARRLAMLQKRRELRAAGIDMGKRRSVRLSSRDSVNYNEEIPFQMQPPTGFYATPASETPDAKGFVPKSLQELEGKRRDDVEEKKRKEDAKRQKMRKETDLPQTVQRINQLNDPAQVRRRAPLVLPAPQVSDSELEQIAKIGSAALVAPNDGSSVTDQLMGQYESVRGLTPARTRTPATPKDTILQDAQALLALQNSSTPLLGGESVSDETMRLGSATPAKRGGETPSALSSGGLTPARTPQSVRSTPLRDEFAINADGGDASDRIRQAMVRKRLKEGLGALPKPQKQFKIAPPELEEEEEDDAEGFVEDASDREARLQQQRKDEQERRMRLSTAVIQRGLPRPMSLPSKEKLVDAMTNAKKGKLTAAEKLLTDEMAELLLRDMSDFPIDGSKMRLRKPEFNESDIAKAKGEIAAEMRKVDDSIDAVDVIENERSNFVIDVPSQSFVRAGKGAHEQMLQEKRFLFEMICAEMAMDGKKLAKVEKKNEVVTKGLLKRGDKLRHDIEGTHAECVKRASELACFKEMQVLEKEGGNRRIEKLRSEVEASKEREKEGQKYFKALQDVLNGISTS
uniref:Uncharacterized protein n=2 Tax=Palpitomonas bilix TaxID=652834 RepID=A0A7S3G7K3_9EUKA|mmetsp:Transcript_28073/g.71555  ORF Transcript_28073/g.71555 Transcript_28073/m.71555 type:complete len:748 (+) Transcript_28073:138-2381(+)